MSSRDSGRLGPGWGSEPEGHLGGGWPSSMRSGSSWEARSGCSPSRQADTYVLCTLAQTGYPTRLQMPINMSSGQERCS